MADRTQACEHCSSLRRLHSVRSEDLRYLDVGCGNGFITELGAPGFHEIVGIDVEEEWLEEFRAHVSDQTSYRVSLMSAASMALPHWFFSFITCFEVLEHVADLEATVREIIRVCRPRGIIVPVPQVWFPCENHGARIGKRVYDRKIPLLPYIRPLRRKYSLARVFSSADMDRFFVSKDMELMGTSYASPRFERAATRQDSWESRLVFVRDILDRCEQIPILRA